MRAGWHERGAIPVMIKVEELLAAAAEAPPCGPNLEYDREFQLLEQAARGKPEQELGDTRIPAVPPDWSEVRRRAEALFARTKDLRVATLLARALVRLSGVAGLAEGLALVRAMLERCWDHVHPELDAEDRDPTMRLNALAALMDPEALLCDLRQAAILPPVKQGRVTVRELLIAAGKMAPTDGEQVKSLAEAEAIVRQAAAEQPPAARAVASALEDVDTIHALVAGKVGHERAPNFAPLRELLAPAAALCGRALGASAPAAANREAGVAPAAAAAAPARGEIASREDVTRMLDRVCDFIERTEPANPAPLLIRRARRLMAKDFLEIIADMAPESLAAIRSVAGIKSE
jgi:type VI secretion system protein ImpA